MRYKILLSGALAAIILAMSCAKKEDDKETIEIDSLTLLYSVINTLPHNSEAFTEGLVIYDNKILESTGMNGTSWIAEVDPGSGQHEKKVILNERYFGEGITILNDKLYQLTYKNKLGFVYDVKTYDRVREFEYNSEGWGITHNGESLIMSDGTNSLYFLDTVNLQVSQKLKVFYPGRAELVNNLNELEYIDGFVFANVWETSWILKIDPANGAVVGRLDLSSLSSEIKRMYPASDVLNGIAYDKNSKALLVTGKLWPKSYLIKLQ